MTLVLVEPEEPIDPLDQARRMRVVIVDMLLLMYGNAMKWDSSFSSGKPTGGECPPGESRPLHTQWQQRFVMAAPADREQVIADATDALIRARVRTDPVPEGETPEQWEERLIKDGEGADPRWVATQFNTSTKLVVRLRVKYERAPHDGRPLEVQSSPRELAVRGLTARQIALVLKCSASSAQYHVNKAKRAA